MTTRIRTNIEAIRANGEFIGWRTQQYVESQFLYDSLYTTFLLHSICLFVL